jgi:hypothetical protein
MRLCGTNVDTHTTYSQGEKGPNPEVNYRQFLAHTRARKRLGQPVGFEAVSVGVLARKRTRIGTMASLTGCW